MEHETGNRVTSGNDEQPLTIRQQLLIEEYCTGAKSGKPFNKRAAMEVAGYSENTRKAATIWRRPHVKKALQERLQELTMSKEEVIKRFNDIATSNPGDVLKLDPVTNRLVVDHEALSRKTQFIKSFGYDSNGNPKYEFHDAHAALRDLAKAMGVHGPDMVGGGVTNVTVNVNFVVPGQNIDNIDNVLPPEPIEEAEWSEDEEG